MRDEGPELEALTRRLAECPADILAEPRTGGGGVVHVDAVVSDLLLALGGEPLDEEGAAPFRVGRPDRGVRNRLRLVLVAAWLLHDPWFAARGRFAGAARPFLVSGLDALATLVDAPQCVNDPDRREELARRALAALGLRPAGETAAQAQDRLTTLDSVERKQVIATARSVQEHARKIWEALRKKAAEEAAAKVSRE
jgi:hypothetical protein